MAFKLKEFVVKQKGWRAIYSEETEETVLPEWVEGDVLPVKSYSLTEGKTKSKPLHTEANLLADIEKAGKETKDEELHQSLKTWGIGTLTTRASIIETLFQRKYMVRQKKAFVPAEKGLPSTR